MKEALPTSVNGDVYAVVDRAVSNANAATGMAKSLAEHIGSTWAEAEGTCKGNPFVQAGQSVTVENVPGYFTGKWVVTQARHVFDQSDPYEGYLTHFVVSGRQDRTLLGLTSLGASNPGAADTPRINGVVPAVCVDNNDPDKKGRVRIALPWLGDNYVSDWCRCMMTGMGQKGGWMLLPEPDDEVLVAFEFGDIRRPYVIGGLSNPKDSKKVAIPKVTMGKVEERGFYSRDGHKLVWMEDPTPDPTDAVPKQKTGMKIEDKEGKLLINLDMKQPMGKKIEIQVMGTAGGSKITMDDMGAITIESTQPGSGQVTIKGCQHHDRGPAEPQAHRGNGERRRHGPDSDQGQADPAELSRAATTRGKDGTGRAGRLRRGRLGISAARQHARRHRPRAARARARGGHAPHPRHLSRRTADAPRVRLPGARLGVPRIRQRLAQRPQDRGHELDPPVGAARRDRARCSSRVDAADPSLLRINIFYRPLDTNDRRNLVFPFYTIPDDGRDY